MRIVIAGGSGFLGRPLAASLVADGHEVVVLTRGHAAARGSGYPRPVRWTPDGTAGAWRSEIDGAGAVINLAGESIAAKRWTAAQKQRIADSRVQATRSLVKAIRGATTPPPLFISGSAGGDHRPPPRQPAPPGRAAGGPPPLAA